jgi:hypothetical protein
MFSVLLTRNVHPKPDYMPVTTFFDVTTLIRSAAQRFLLSRFSGVALPTVPTKWPGINDDVLCSILRFSRLGNKLVGISEL